MTDVLLNINQLEEEPDLGPDTNNFYITTDLANQYLLRLIQEKNESNPELRLAMTEGIVLSGTNDKEIKEICALIVQKYVELIENYGAKGIYTVINVAPSLRAPAHQNWIYYDVSRKRIIRFEPNGPGFDRIMGSEYPFKKVLDCISEYLDVEWIQSENVSINPFNGCRATSTILVLMNLLGIDYDVLKSRSDNFLRTLAIQLSRSIQEQKCTLPRLPRKERRTKTLATYVQPQTQRFSSTKEITNKENIKPRRFAKRRNRNPKKIIVRRNRNKINVEDEFITDDVVENVVEEENISVVQQSNRRIDVFDIENSSNTELRNYLRENGVNPGIRTTRTGLIEKVIAFQNTLIFT
jgi:hypothetical protein